MHAPVSSPPVEAPESVAEEMVRVRPTLLQRIVHGAVGALYGMLGPRPVLRGPVRRVLISAYTGLGHFVMKSVLVDHAKAVFDDCSVSVISGGSLGTEEILDGCEVIVHDSHAGRLSSILFFLRLRRQRFDVALFPVDAAPTHILRGALLAGIPVRVGHVFPGAFVPSYYYTHRVPVRLTGPRSELDMNLDLLEAVHGRPFPRQYRPSVGCDDGEAVLNRWGLRAGDYVCIQPGAANGNPTTKRWLEGHFRKLIEALLEHRTGVGIVALGDAGDSFLVDRVCDGFDSTRVMNLAGRTTLAETKALIAGCRLLLCHDSGLLHLGNALGATVVALYGPSDPDIYAERLETFHLLREPCSCPKQGLFPGLFNDTEERAAERCPIPKCMEALSVERVYAKCDELLLLQ